MGKYYKTTPWVIPEMPLSIKNIFRKYGKNQFVKKNTLLSGNCINAQFPNTERLIYLESGLLGQAYETYSLNKPYAMSVVLPGRMVNYLSYLDIDNSGDNIIVLRNSSIYCMTKSEFDKIANNEEKLMMVKQCKASITSDFDGLCCMFTCDTPKRLAYLFKALVEGFYGDITGMSSMKIPIKLSYAEMSYVMYTTIRTIERLLPKWRELGYIETGKNYTIVYSKLFDVMDELE